MREIKFRAWHEDNVSMVYFDNKKASSDHFIAMNMCALMNGDFGNVMMQFTGVKDKNGVDIYEGDVVLLDDGDGEPWKSNVYFDGGALCVDVEHCEFDFIAIGWATLESIEVIGNIHENPDLLN